MHVLKHMHTY